MIRRLVVPEGSLSNTVIHLSGPPLHYLSHVLRLAAGEQVELVDGAGGRCLARLERISRKEAEVRVEQRLPDTPPPARPLTLVYGLSRGRRTELVLQKATELGVDRVIPVLCGRSVSRPGSAEAKGKRWAEIIAQAGRQCGRARFPRLEPLCSVEEGLSLAISVAPGPGVRLMAHLGGHALAAAWEEAGAGGGVTLAVGPEGGFTDQEADRARELGYRLVSLGPNTLRTETAAVALLAITAHLTGRLEPPSGCA